MLQATKFFEKVIFAKNWIIASMRATFGTGNFFKEPLFWSIYFSIDFLSGYCSLALIFFSGRAASGNDCCYKDLFEPSNFCKSNIFFLKAPLWVVHYLKRCVILFERRSCDRTIILSDTLSPFGGTAWVIHSLM